MTTSERLPRILSRGTEQEVRVSERTYGKSGCSACQDNRERDTARNILRWKLGNEQVKRMQGEIGSCLSTFTRQGFSWVAVGGPRFPLQAPSVKISTISDIETALYWQAFLLQAHTPRRSVKPEIPSEAAKSYPNGGWRPVFQCRLRCENIKNTARQER
jgi:hypothetical protein